MTKPSKALVWSLGHSLGFADLSKLGKINWPVLLSEADEQGRFLTEPKNYKRSICPIVDEIQVEDVEGLLAELQGHGMIFPYEWQGVGLGQVVNWWVYQKGVLWRDPSRWPPPEGWVDRVRFRKGQEIITVNWDSPGGFVGGAPDNITEHNITQHNYRMKMPSEWHEHDMSMTSKEVSEEVKKERKTPDTPHHQVVDFYLKQIAKGYEKRYEQKFRGDLRAIKAMLERGRTAEEIQACYLGMKSEPFWASKHLSMMKVDQNIDDWLKARGAGGDHKGRSGKLREAGKRSPELERWAREQDSVS